MKASFYFKPLRLQYNTLLTLLFILVAGLYSIGLANAAENAVDATTGETATNNEKWGDLELIRAGVDVQDASHIIVFLHGLGGNASNMTFLNERFQIKPTTAFIYPNGPLTAQNGGKAWMLQQEDLQTSRDKVFELIKYLRSQNESAKIILGGYSQGAIISSNLIDESPQLLSAVMLVVPSGQVLKEPRADALNKPLIFHTHGRNDQILPFANSEALYEKLEAAGYEVVWFPHDGNHGIPPELPPELQKFLDRAMGD